MFRASQYRISNGNGRPASTPVPIASASGPGLFTLLVPALLISAAIVGAALLHGRQGLDQRVRFDRYQQAQRLSTALGNLRSELEACQPVIDGNLVKVRMLLLARHLSRLDGVQSSLESLDADIQKLEQRIAGEQVERNLETLRGQLKRKLEARDRLLRDQEQAHNQSQHYRFLFEEMPDVEGLDGGYLGHVSLDRLPLPVWQSIADSELRHELDAALVHRMTRFKGLADGLAQTMADYQRFDPLQPTRIQGSIWDSTRREDQLVEMQTMISQDLLPTVQEWLAACAQDMQNHIE